MAPFDVVFIQCYCSHPTKPCPASAVKMIGFRCLDSPHFFCWQEKTYPCFPEFHGRENTIPFKCLEEKRGESSVSAVETGRVSAMVLRRKGSKPSVNLIWEQLGWQCQVDPLSVSELQLWHASGSEFSLPFLLIRCSVRFTQKWAYVSF